MGNISKSVCNHNSGKYGVIGFRWLASRSVQLKIVECGCSEWSIIGRFPLKISTEVARAVLVMINVKRKDNLDQLMYNITLNTCQLVMSVSPARTDMKPGG